MKRLLTVDFISPESNQGPVLWPSKVDVGKWVLVILAKGLKIISKVYIWVLCNYC